MSSTDNESSNSAAGRAEHLETVVVKDELRLTLVVSEWLTVPVRTCFTYRTDDPYAVHLLFHFDAQEPVPWLFARDLLTAGMSGRAGIADVTVRPARDPSVTSLSLASPHGRVQVEAPTLPLATWLARTHRAVPAGHESRYFDLDVQVECLMQQEPGRPRPRPKPVEEEPAGRRHGHHDGQGTECPWDEHTPGMSTAHGERIGRGDGGRPGGRPQQPEASTTTTTGRSPGTGCMS